MNAVRIKDLLKTFSKFFVSNILGTIVDTIVLWLFAHIIFNDQFYVWTLYFSKTIISPIISFEFAVLTNYLCAYYLTWRGRLRLKTLSKFLIHYMKYNLTATGAFFIKMGFLLLFQNLFHWDVVICNLVALIFSGSFNFAMGEWWLFRIKKEER